MNDYQREAVQEIARQAKEAGLRVFIAERGHYGFITDAAGSRVMGFQVNGIESAQYGGNYVPESIRDGRNVGTGWRIDPEGTEPGVVAAAWEHSARPPRWATKGVPVKLATLKHHLSRYQESSRYKEQ